MLAKPDLRFVLSLDFLAYLREYIDIQMSSPSSYNADDDKIILAALWEIRQKVNLKLATSCKKNYSMKLSACQAIAIRQVYTSFDIGNNPWFSNELRKISDSVHRHYSL